MAASALMEESVWLQQPRFEEAEAFYHAVLSGAATPGSFGGSGSSLVDQISQTRQAIHNVLNRNSRCNGTVTKICKITVTKICNGTVTKSGGAGDSLDEASMNRLEALEKENKSLKKAQDDLKKLVERLEKRVAQLEVGGGTAPAAKDTKAAPAKGAKAGDDDDDFDLFGSDDEEDSAEAERIKQERLELYKKKKAGKTAVIAKSSVVIDVKPWDDETDMAMLEQEVRNITMDGLVWGASKLVEVGYGIKKLQIMMTIEDDKVSVEDLNEQITEDKAEYVQSVDIVAFNKI